jgi:hypothetical protein
MFLIKNLIVISERRLVPEGFIVDKKHFYFNWAFRRKNLTIKRLNRGKACASPITDFDGGYATCK